MSRLAFPQALATDHEGNIHPSYALAPNTSGMTLREYIAIQIIAQCGPFNDDRSHAYMAECAVKQADALIKELERPSNDQR